MDFATTTCAYSNPVQFDGSAPGSSLDYFQFASSTCITVSPPASTTVELLYGSSAENPLITADSGSIVFGLGLILFVLVFAVLGVLFVSEKRSRK